MVGFTDLQTEQDLTDCRKAELGGSNLNRMSLTEEKLIEPLLIEKSTNPYHRPPQPLLCGHSCGGAC